MKLWKKKMRRALARGTLLCLTALLAFCPLRVAAGETSAIRSVPATETMDFWSLSNSLQVFCIPVGAQDCYLIVCDGHAMMLDCAGLGRDPTPDFLLKLLEGLGIRRLDFALNTHPHRDHINGFPELFQKVPTGEYLTVFPLKYDKHQRLLLKQLEEMKVPVRLYTEGEPLPLGGAEIQTYRYHKSTNTNDLSLVVHIRYGQRSVLFTADIGLTAQRKMAVEYGDAWRSDILKLPHHGTGGLSTELVEAAQPEICFVSNGETSHSVDIMRKFLQKRNIPILYTSRKPLVMITDGKTWEIQQWAEDSIQLPGYVWLPQKDEK